MSPRILNEREITYIANGIREERFLANIVRDVRRRDRVMDVVQQIREEIGLSKRAFAKVLGVDERTLARLEAGAPARGLTIGLLAALRGLLDQYGSDMVRRAIGARGGRMEVLWAEGVRSHIRKDVGGGRGD